LLTIGPVSTNDSKQQSAANCDPAPKISSAFSAVEKWQS